MEKMWIKIHGEEAENIRSACRQAVYCGMKAPSPDKPQPCNSNYRVLHDFTVEKLVDPAEVGRNFCIKVLGISPEKCDELAAKAEKEKIT